ncbi:MAG: RidA family protein [Acidovorax sp.]|jgi:enamine deaminase RidA (YjgF/YER057c/UK114 family)|nr:RidA family protein [Acidovorax sp.]
MSFRAPLLLASLLASLALAGCATQTASTPELLRYKLPGSNFPIANAVEVPAGASTVYLSGKTATLKDKSKSPTDIAAYGDTETQAVSVLQTIDAQLKGMGLSMSDVVKMQVYLVKDPAKNGKMDFAGFMKGYSQFFGTAAQPHLPARSTFEVAALANPALLVEIEVVAVRGATSISR